MFTVTLETWLEDCCTDDDFYDRHIQVFQISRRTLKRIIRENGWISLKWFYENSTYDMTDRVYREAKNADLVLTEWIERSAI